MHRSMPKKIPTTLASPLLGSSMTLPCVQCLSSACCCSGLRACQRFNALRDGLFMPHHRLTMFLCERGGRHEPLSCLSADQQPHRTDSVNGNSIRFLTLLPPMSSSRTPQSG